MNTITTFLARYFEQPDKVLHAAAGAIAQAVLRLLLPGVFALAFVAAIAWGKERYDKAHATAHTPDGWDAYATLIGGLVLEVAWTAVMFLRMAGTT